MSELSQISELHCAGKTLEENLKSRSYYVAHFLMGEPNSLGGQSRERGGNLSAV